MNFIRNFSGRKYTGDTFEIRQHKPHYQSLQSQNSKVPARCDIYHGNAGYFLLSSSTQVVKLYRDTRIGAWEVNKNEQSRKLERLRRHLNDGTMDLSPYSLKVPASHYVSETQNALEVEILFRQRPLLVALTPHIPRQGDYLSHEVIDTSLLLVRDQQDNARAYINACRHRGARLAEGRGHKRSFSCPFHAWNWSLDGKIVARPNSHEGFEAVDDCYDSLIELPCYEIAGLIFVLLEGDDIELKVQDLMGASLPDIENYNIANTSYIDSRTTELNCNYKFFLDGFAETYHIAPLHKETISPFYYSNSTLVDRLGEVVHLVSPRKTIDKEFEKDRAEQGALLPYCTTEYLLAPNVLLTHQVDHIQFWTVYPVDGANRCRIELNVFWPKPMDEEDKRKAKLNVDLVWQVTTEEDFPQSVAIHRNLMSGAIPDIVFGQNEPALIYYHQNIAAAIDSDKLIPLVTLHDTD